MPLWMWNNVLDQLVLPKLQNGVELWDPLTDGVPLHSWLHPWLPYLGQQLEIVYPTIRNKLASALTAWHPSDLSAKNILLPWKDVFPKVRGPVVIRKKEFCIQHECAFALYKYCHMVLNHLTFHNFASASQTTFRQC